ncbi:unnamed protein product [Sphagnum tenellum]
MKNSNLQSGGRLVLLLMVAVAMSWLALGLVDAAQINITNQCPEVISACQSNQSGIVTCYALAAGTGSQLIDVGTTWLGGLIWGYPGSSASPIDGNNAKPQADLAEITINGFSNTDSYDLSNVITLTRVYRVLLCGCAECLKSGIAYQPNNDCAPGK